MITFGLVNSTFFGGYDFRIIAFVNVPVFICGKIFQLIAEVEIGQQLGSTEEINYARNSFSFLIIAVGVTAAFYFKQYEQSVLIIEKDKSVKLNRQINNLFQSNQDGIVVFSLQEVDD